MKRVAFRIIPKEREWLVMPLTTDAVLDKPISHHTSRTKALNSTIRKVFKDHPGRRAFDLILEVEDEKLET